MKAMKTMCRLAGWLGWALLASGCVSFSEPLPTDSGVEPGSGYLFGRFTLARGGVTFLKPGRMGLLVQSTTGGESRVLEFEDEGDGIVAVAVPPGMYAVSSVVAANGDHSKEGSIDVTEPWATASFQVSAGQAYYLGDYRGLIRKTWGIRWELRSVFADARTVSEFKAKYPSLGQLPVIEPLRLRSVPP